MGRTVRDAERTVPRQLLGGVSRRHPREQRRLDRQGELFAPLAAWTLDALGIGPGNRVLEIGCGGGGLLAEVATRVGPTGSVVGVDRDAALLATARERVAPWPRVEIIWADAVNYRPDDAGFDAVHCRLVLMHQADPQAFVAHLVALARPGGRVAVQEYDMDGPTDAPALICHPTFPALERAAAAVWAARQARGVDFHSGRKALARLGDAGLHDLRVHAAAIAYPLGDPALDLNLDMFARPGASAEVAAAGFMSADEYESLLAEIRAARQDPAFAHVMVRHPLLVATVGQKPGPG
jgi:SAM-dependent methyltransferase